MHLQLYSELYDCNSVMTSQNDIIITQ